MTKVDADDVELLRLWREGNNRAGAQLVERHLPAVRGFVERRYRGDVDDLLQETLLASMGAIHRFRGDSSFRTFLMSIARKKMRQERYRWARRQAIISLETEVTPIVPEDARRAVEQEANRLATAIACLTPLLRSVLQLTYWDGLTRSQISERLGIPPGTVASRLRHAREALAIALPRES